MMYEVHVFTVISDLQSDDEVNFVINFFMKDICCEAIYVSCLLFCAFNV